MKEVSRLFLASMLIVTAMGVSAAGGERSSEAPELARKVRRALERVPYYGVYDFLAFKAEPGLITLQGYAHRPSLKREAEAMVRHATGVDVANKIELLPSSTFDDRIRFDTFQRIYTDEFADRYVPGGAMRARYELVTMARFGDMEPFGTYPVHIIVKNRHVALIGVVVNEADKTQVVVRARQVAHTISVEDVISIAR